MTHQPGGSYSGTSPATLPLTVPLIHEQQFNPQMLQHFIPPPTAHHHQMWLPPPHTNDHVMGVASGTGEISNNYFHHHSSSSPSLEAAAAGQTLTNNSAANQYYSQQNKYCLPVTSNLPSNPFALTAGGLVESPISNNIPVNTAPTLNQSTTPHLQPHLHRLNPNIGNQGSYTPPVLVSPRSLTQRTQQVS